jgi:hypothetical protein
MQSEVNYYIQLVIYTCISPVDVFVVYRNKTVDNTLASLILMF